MVEPGLLQQRQPNRAGEVAGHWFVVVVEVDEQRLAEAALDEAVGVPVEARVGLLAVQAAHDVVGENLALEVRDRAGLGRRDRGRVADHEHVRTRGGDQRVRVGGHEVERVAEPGGAADPRGAAVCGHDHREVEGDLAAVVGRPGCSP